MLVQQVQGVTGKLRAAAAPALDQKRILVACFKVLRISPAGPTLRVRPWVGEFDVRVICQTRLSGTAAIVTVYF